MCVAGNIPEDRFVEYFVEALKKEEDGQFDTTVEQFMECAKACREGKLAERKAADAEQAARVASLEAELEQAKLSDADSMLHLDELKASMGQQKLKVLTQFERVALQRRALEQELSYWMYWTQWRSFAGMSAEHAKRKRAEYSVNEVEVENDALKAEEEKLQAALASRTESAQQLTEEKVALEHWVESLLADIKSKLAERQAAEAEQGTRLEQLAQDKQELEAKLAVASQENKASSEHCEAQLSELEARLAAATQEKEQAIVHCDLSKTEIEAAMAGEKEKLLASLEGMRRAALLQKVYNEFDLDGGGDVGEEELLELGQARRRLGQKSGEWTEANNRTMMQHIGPDEEGIV